MAHRKGRPAKVPAQSTLTDLQRAEVRRLLDPLCKPDPRPDVSRQLRFGYRHDGPAVVYFAARPDWRGGPEWIEHPIAKFRFTKRTGLWSLYCQHSDLQWHGYQPLPHASSLAELVAEVERDPTGIFHG